jgi:hypothetical protein
MKAEMYKCKICGGQFKSKAHLTQKHKIPKPECEKYMIYTGTETYENNGKLLYYCDHRGAFFKQFAEDNNIFRKRIFIDRVLKEPLIERQKFKLLLQFIRDSPVSYDTVYFFDNRDENFELAKKMLNGINVVLIDLPKRERYERKK